MTYQASELETIHRQPSPQLVATTASPDIIVIRAGMAQLLELTIPPPPLQIPTTSSIANTHNRKRVKTTTPCNLEAKGFPSSFTTQNYFPWSLSLQCPEVSSTAFPSTSKTCSQEVPYCSDDRKPYIKEVVGTTDSNILMTFIKPTGFKRWNWPWKQDSFPYHGRTILAVSILQPPQAIPADSSVKTIWPEGWSNGSKLMN